MVAALPVLRPRAVPPEGGDWVRTEPSAREALGRLAGGTHGQAIEALGRLVRVPLGEGELKISTSRP